MTQESLRDRNQSAITWLRIAVGILFLIFAEYKVLGTQFTLHGGFEFWINRFIEGGAYPFALTLLKDVVLPHARFFAFAAAYGELAIGMALTFGVWARAASVYGFFYMMALLFSSNYPGAHAPLWQYFGAALDHLVLAMCFCAFVVAGPARRFSLARPKRGRDAT